MKMQKFLLAIAAVLVFSCAGDKQAKLNQLKKDHDKITEEINKLEQELQGDKKESGKLVTVMAVKPAEFSHCIEVQGKLDGEESVSLTSPIGGNVKVIYVKAGQSVTKGQIIVELDHDAYSAQLNALQANQKLIDSVYKKTKNLWDQKIGSEMQYLQARASKDAIDNQVKALQEQVDMLIIKSPINGAVEDMPLKVGQLASAQIPASYIKVVGFGKVKVVADVAEGYASKVNVGDKVKAFFPDINKEATASVTFASRFINPINRSFLVEANLQGEIPGLKANMVAMLRITDYSKEKAISLPVNYIQNDGKGTYVLVAEDGKAKKKMVKSGVIYNGLAEILEGLKEGDNVITSGYLDLEEGQIIRF
jgi:membrane fusion protein, multidrug efflux system